MKIHSLKQAESSIDIDVKLVAVRSSRYRVFGSSERIPETEMMVVDLRDGKQPADFDATYRVLNRHPAWPILLVRKIG
jgi:hypothetical protein